MVKENKHNKTALCNTRNRARYPGTYRLLVQHTDHLASCQPQAQSVIISNYKAHA